MITAIHCADLHLTAGEEREYSLAVLEEIVGVVAREKAQCLLICGDLFDSFEDACELRADVRRITAALVADVFVLYIPGNHEELRRGRGELATLDLGCITLAMNKPYAVVRPIPGIEFLSIPHQDGYLGYQEWNIPPRGNDVRIAAAHGLVGCMDIYSGPESVEEVPAGAIDPDMFVRFGVDYAAMGHIHMPCWKVFGDTQVRYCGSARVWRRGESGEHGVCVLRLGSSFTAEQVTLGAAGRYRDYSIALDLEGTAGDIEPLARSWGEHDWVDLHLSGIVENENTVSEVVTHIQRRYARRVRRLEIHRDGVRPLPGIASQPLAARFLREWAARRPAEEEGEHAERVWYKARELGLEQIVRILEAR